MFPLLAGSWVIVAEYCELMSGVEAFAPSHSVMSYMHIGNESSKCNVNGKNNSNIWAVVNSRSVHFSGCWSVAAWCASPSRGVLVLGVFMLMRCSISIAHWLWGTGNQVNTRRVKKEVDYSGKLELLRVLIKCNICGPSIDDSSACQQQGVCHVWDMVGFDGWVLMAVLLRGC